MKQDIVNKLTALSLYVHQELQVIISQVLDDKEHAPPVIETPEPDVESVSTYANVFAMINSEDLVDGEIVTTASYYEQGDKGGASYLITTKYTDYSIPLLGGLHAVYQDSNTFDIRKFGIKNSATLDQTQDIKRMRNYADSREYVIDFHGFSIMTPDDNAGLSGGQSIINGLWFNHLHCIQNLFIANDKTKRLESGKCCIIFTPIENPTEIGVFKLLNVTFDAWVDNVQAFPDNYSNWGDGLRMGFIALPRNGKKSFIDWGVGKENVSNINFEFENINFASMAYSYSITVSNIRCRSVKVKGLRGDTHLGVNFDAVNFYAEDVAMRVRYDRVEKGRMMVSDVFHTEPEHSNPYKDGITFVHDLISLDNCHATAIDHDGSATSGQLLWTSPLRPTIYKNIKVNNCSGNVELMRPVATHENVEITNCKKHIWLSLQSTTVGKVKISNSNVERIRKTNTGNIQPAYKSTVELWEFDNVDFAHRWFYDVVRSTPAIKKVTFNNIRLNYDVNLRTPFIDRTNIEHIVITNSELPNVRSGLIRNSANIKKLELDNVGFDKLDDSNLVNLVYTDNTSDTDMTLNNIRINSHGRGTRFSMSGRARLSNITSDYPVRVRLPTDLDAKNGRLAGSNKLEVIEA